MSSDEREEVENPCSDANKFINRYFFEYKPDNTKYIQCDEYNSFQINDCNDGTIYNSALNACIYPFNNSN
jgi:hypothetical protein